MESIEGDPFLLFKKWENSLDQRTSIHHCVPRKRHHVIQVVRLHSGIDTNSSNNWNKKKIDHVSHQLWHRLMGRFTPWEAIIFLNRGSECFDSENIWHAFTWLMIFGGFSAKQAAKIIESANGNLPQVCLELVPSVQAKEVVLRDFTTPVVKDYTFIKLHQLN